MKQKNFLNYIVVACLLLSVDPLHAAQQQPQNEPAVYDYTLKHHPNVSNKVASLDALADIPLELKALAKTDSRQDTNVQPNLLALTGAVELSSVYKQLVQQWGSIV